ncbi:sulfite exporter TauE/SafE family protein [Saccharopolyspora mangrovi]|uniref:Probable membrane transporter protein n=1 Tax=Saccharopolyspora mangrovi TaxID=3082379 RepID=A0ABU6AL51_9PSEU|nr:sulfite exporter TauE/SafE family protein [Saccharopolyspora sp. S2-29]MEB3372119.1 sulfite exporter TauE/SafE family protein [Saccharopolyspora sp. S2-29]
MTSVLIPAAVCVAAAAVVGGITGFAASLLVTPALLLLGFEVSEVVVINLTATLVTRVTALRVLRRDVEWRAVGLLSSGGLPGAVAGAATASLVNREVLTVVAGVAVVIAGTHMLVERNVEQRRSVGPVPFVAAGTIGGYLSTTISVNGPPVAILLGATRRTPTQYVADFAGYFVAVNAMSLGTLVVCGRVDGDLLWPVLPVLVAAAMVGNRVGMRLHPRVPARAFHTSVAVLVIAAGVATLVA